VLIAAQRKGPVWAQRVDDDSIGQLKPVIENSVSKEAWIMSDGHRSYKNIASDFAGHSSIKHSQREYANGSAHVNTAESFAAMLERVKEGVFHYISGVHLDRYLKEISFRWQHRIPHEKKTKKGKRKITWTPMPVISMLKSLLTGIIGKQNRRTANSGLAFFYS
jgi:hypothetical protein